MDHIIGGLAGYLIGSVNPSYLVGKRKGFDIRQRGSGNAGASNALILLGKRVGILIALFDIFKAFFTVKVMTRIFSRTPLIAEVTGAATILGHIFPPFMKFHGGKGLSCLGGVVLAYDPLVFLCMLLCAIPLLLITKYICLLSMSAAVAFPIIVAYLEKNILCGVILGVAGVAILLRHLKNVKRIFQGTEARISFLWNKEKELSRLRENGMDED